MRKKLIEIAGGVLNNLPWGEITLHTAEDIAERLIDNGVTIPVRCKDCKYWDGQNKELYTYDSKPENKDNMVDFAECLYWSCWSTCHSTRFNDFCSLGERRNDG